MKDLLIFGLSIALIVCAVVLFHTVRDLQFERGLNDVRMETAAKAQRSVGRVGK